MALFHRATITPTKEEVIATWAPAQPWGPPRHESVDVIRSYRFDDPEGRVGMETFLFRVAGQMYQAPLTYRDAPLKGSESALIAELTHSVLGPRWVYDGLHDPRFVMMLAAASMTGQGEALGMAVYDDAGTSHLRLSGSREVAGLRRRPGRRLRARDRRGRRRTSAQREVRTDPVPSPPERHSGIHASHRYLARPGWSSGPRLRPGAVAADQRKALIGAGHSS